MRTLITRAPFSCSKCGSRQTVHFPDGISTPPTRCISNGCRSRKFTEDRDGAQGVDVQRVRLQELPGRNASGPMMRIGGDAGMQGGEEGDIMARTLDVELTGSLCDALAAGDAATVTGIVHALADGAAPSAGHPAGGAAAGKQKADERAAATFVLHINAVSLVRSRRERSHSLGEALEDTRLVVSGPPACVMTHARHNETAPRGGEQAGGPRLNIGAPFNDTQLAFVAHFAAVAASETGPTSCGAWRLLTQSLCPSIHGHEASKAGLILALLGGTRPPAIGHGGIDGHSMSLRHDIHVLLVGDPGVGKSQLLGAVAAASPRGIYVSGPGATSVGLTASVGRDPATGGPCLEAGACALASGGTVCVDELDKLPKVQHGALLEVMEQGTVSVAKAGVTASMDARCSVVAAANPAGGRYNPANTLAENLRLSAALLSRFSLVFLLVDQHDAQHDADMAASVVATHQGTAAGPPTRRPRLHGPAQQPGQTAPLRSRLGARPDDEPVPMPLLRKYIEYARAYARPLMTAEAEAVIVEFYLTLRSRCARVPGSLPVTVRTLEALVCLSEARARCDLREAVSAQDAADVVELMRLALPDTFTGDGMPGAYGGGGRAGGSFRGLKGEPARLLAALTAEAITKDGGYLSYGEIVAVADRIQINVPDLTAVVDKLNYDGDLLKHGRLYSVRGAAA